MASPSDCSAHRAECASGGTHAASVVWNKVRRVLLASVVYVVILAASVWTTKALRTTDGATGVTDTHRDAARSCVLKPSGEALCDVGGLVEAKGVLRRAILFPLKYPNIFFHGPLPLRPPRGVLLHGPPGTGKTMLVRALASESNVPFLSLSSAALESKWWGESGKLIQAAFEVAREMQPCILFFDEIDGIGRARSGEDQSCVYAFKTELLRNLDGAEQHSAAVVVVACTNCLQLLDPALRRRLPLLVPVNPPDEEARREILARLTRDETPPDAPDEGDALDWVAKRTPGFTGSDLAALYAEASAARLERVDVPAVLAAGDVSDGASLLAHVGRLRHDHWRVALQSGRPAFRETGDASPPCRLQRTAEGSSRQEDDGTSLQEALQNGGATG